MATSPLFGWEEPDDTDLVKDGAAAMRTLGNAIDTSMGDLLGGTSGQILSKASATDMDFAWITNDVGDITAVGVTSPITGGGTSGAVTIAIQDATTAQKGAVQLSDSTSTTSSILASTPTAVKSAYDLANTANTAVTTNNFFAGKNKIINGNFGIWQRGTTFTNPGFNAYTSDRWVIGLDNVPTSYTVSRQTFTPGTAPVSGYEGTFFYRSAITTVGTNIILEHKQKIEDVRTFAGQTAIVSFWAKADSARIATSVLYQDFGTGGSGVVNAFNATFNLTTSWQRFTMTGNVASISAKTIGTNSFLGLNIQQVSASGSTIDIWGVQVEAGSVATAFQTATGTIQGELAACQRYYERLSAGDVYSAFANGHAYSTTTALITLPLRVPKRTTVSATLEYASLSLGDYTGSGIAVTSLVQATATGSTNTMSLIASVASGLTSLRPYQLLANNSSSAYVGFNSEL